MDGQTPHPAPGSEPERRSPPTAPMTPSDIDLYCLNCGYNLRGLSGDPRRCPECGHLNPLGDLHLPAELITKQVRRMESAPAYCVAVLLGCAVLLGFWTLIIVSDVGRGERPDPTGVICMAGGLMIGIAVWASCARAFRDACQRKPRWGHVLWSYHLTGVLLVVPVLVLLLGPMWFFEFHLEGRVTTRDQEKARFVVMLGSIALTPLYILTIGRWAHRRATREMDQLQREVAVTLAKKRLRSDLSSPGRRPFAP